MERYHKSVGENNDQVHIVDGLSMRVCSLEAIPITARSLKDRLIMGIAQLKMSMTMSFKGHIVISSEGVFICSSDATAVNIMKIYCDCERKYTIAIWVNKLRGAIPLDFDGIIIDF
jgi:hypothetical protein